MQRRPTDAKKRRIERRAGAQRGSARRGVAWSAQRLYMLTDHGAT